MLRAGYLLFGTLLCGLLLTGCGSKEPFAYVPVSGTVTYEDGSLIQADSVEVTFYPQAPPKDPKTHPRPGVCIVNLTDGSFKDATSHKPGDGIVPGAQKVTVQTFDSTHTPTDVLPKEYTDPSTTPLTYDTTSNQPAVIKVPKKK